MIDRYQCQVFGFDPTPKAIEWCNRQSLPENFHLIPYGIHSKSGKVDFFLPDTFPDISGSVVPHNPEFARNRIEVEMRTFSDFHQELQHSRIDILKMDIEGSEYDVIDGILEAGLNIPQMAIELHGRFFRDGLKRSQKLVSTMNAYGYKIFAVSRSGHEISFVLEEVLGSDRV